MTEDTKTINIKYPAEYIYNSKTDILDKTISNMQNNFQDMHCKVTELQKSHEETKKAIKQLLILMFTIDGALILLSLAFLLFKFRT